MFNRLFINLSKYKNFWKIRNWIIGFKFWIESNLYSVRYHLSDKRENTSSFLELLRITFSGVVLSFFIVIILVLVDPFLSSIYEYFHIKIPDSEEYVTFFATVSGIGGVFIGLYYAAISTVSASVYSQVANNIRALLLKEKIGNVYMRYLSIITFVSLIVMTLRILLQMYISIAVLFIIILSGIGIIAFVKLGQRAFYLFDPTNLSHTIFYEIRKYLQMVIVGGYKWRDQNFQAHAHKLVDQNIDTIETLSSIVKNSPHLAGQPYFDLVRNLVGFLIFYQHQKSKIPNNSNWYDVIYVHKNWYQVEETALNIADNAGIQLNPDKEFDYVWIENKLLPIIYDCIRINLQANNQKLVFSLLQYFNKFIEVVSKNGDLDKSIKYLKELEKFVFELVRDKYIKSKNIRESLVVVGFYELLVTSTINTFLSFLKSFEIYNRSEISKRLSDINWMNKESIFKSDFPYFCAEHMQWLSDRIDFELKVEGRVVTPNWYQSEILCFHIFNKLSYNVNLIFDSVFELINKWKKNYSSNEFIWINSAILSREWELFHKIQMGLFQLKQVSNNIYESRSIEGLDWKITNWNKNETNLMVKKTEILKEMSKKVVELSELDKPNEFPDYHGQFLHTLSESMIDAICENQTELLESIFGSFFYGCLKKSDDLKPKVNKIDWRVEHQFKIAVAPLLDLVEISGYGFLMFEFYKNPKLWEIVKSTWDVYLASDAELKLAFISSSIHIAENAYEIEYRGFLRTSWKQKVERILASLPKKQIFRKGYSIPIPVEYIEHSSALVRIMGREPIYSMYDGIDIFSYCFLLEHPQSKDLSFSRNGKELKNEIQGQENRK